MQGHASPDTWMTHACLQVRLAWEALLARQPGFDIGLGKAAVRALVLQRLQGKVASTKAAAARKRIFERGESGFDFVMCKVPPPSG